ncbi:MAG TPA: hypothetical protein VER79_04110 [Candidatus Limnocylindrales bacterium]|nr:hypothetical protein [Candidatus Limnocylindrales bacterium]
MTDLPDFEPAAFWQSPDFLLTELVSLFANALDAELGLTLLVGGGVISGTLVGERTYLKAVNGMVKRLAREVAEKPTAEELLELAELFNPDRLAEDVLPGVLEAGENGAADVVEIETDELAAPPLRFLHLRDPIVIQPGAMLHFGDSELPIMRVRLAQVAGWIVGRASLVSSDEFDDAFPPGGIVH